jgi:hypothetical protein
MVHSPPRRLATIVGQKTRGTVLGAANLRVGSGYWLWLPSRLPDLIQELAQIHSSWIQLQSL